ncbi:MAG: dNTP triphosphohydrolase [Gloeobacterales cyanobacterium]
MSNQRDERQHGSKKPSDQRHDYAIDRDRLLYSLAFRRLAQVTQVVGAAEGNFFHNRLTHSLKVAQVARRVAEKLIEETGKSRSRSKIGHYLNADVVEAAALAHDLGHPPFGHIAEEELNKAALEAQLTDGFEGNAQTFRILTLLEPNRLNYPGLNLTRATLNATLKYPWTKHSDPEHKHSRKFSVYGLDRKSFDFVREEEEGVQSTIPCLEAKVMEFADDATYSVHDLEDFYLAGLIPLYILAKSDQEFDQLIKDWQKKLIDKNDKETANALADDETKGRLQRMLQFYVTPSANQLAHVRGVSSNLIQKFVLSVRVERKEGAFHLNRNKERDLEMNFLHHLVKKYVIYNPRLASQQCGQKKIISTLFAIYRDAIKDKNLNIIPTKFLQDGSLEHLSKDVDAEQQKVRLAVDIVASMSEPEAVTMYRRFTGIEQGSVMDYIT